MWIIQRILKNKEREPNNLINIKDNKIWKKYLKNLKEDKESNDTIILQYYNMQEKVFKGPKGKEES